MADKPIANTEVNIRLEAAMAGVLALLIDQREERTADDRDSVRTEVLLADAGLSLDEIAGLTGRTYDAVRMTVSRGRSKRAEKSKVGR